MPENMVSTTYHNGQGELNDYDRYQRYLDIPDRYVQSRPIISETVWVEERSSNNFCARCKHGYSPSAKQLSRG